MTKILAFRSNPINEDPLRTGVEINNIEKSITKVIGYPFEIKTIDSPGLNDLQRSLYQLKPEVVHFSGHGTAKGEMIFEDHAGQSLKVQSEGIKAVFTNLKGIKCVMLNICFSMKQAEAIVPHVDCVVAMKQAIDDPLALVFSEEFYTALAEGHSVQGSFVQARAALSLRDVEQACLPELLSSDGIDPGKVFVNFKVRLRAEFTFSRNGNIIKDGKHYDLEMYLEDVPEGVKSVVYFCDDETFCKEKFIEVDNSEEDFRTELTTYGTFTVRISLWKSKGDGIGLTCKLHKALECTYQNCETQEIRDAIQKISLR